jgi:hypothetical protein
VRCADTLKTTRFRFKSDSILYLADLATEFRFVFSPNFGRSKKPRGVFSLAAVASSISTKRLGQANGERPVAVGQIVSSDVEPERRRARGALLRIRLLSSIGHYRQGTIKSAKGIYHLDEQLAFVAVQTNEQRDHAYWSELTLFAFEEIRFLSALLLSMRPDYGVLRLYPGGAHVTEVISNEVDLHQLAGNFAMNARSAVAVPLAGGRPYSVSNQEIDSNARSPSRPWF